MSEIPNNYEAEVNDSLESYGDHLPDGFEKDDSGVFSYIVQESWWIENLLKISAALWAYNKLPNEEMWALRFFLMNAEAEDTQIFPGDTINLSVSEEWNWVPLINGVPMSKM